MVKWDESYVITWIKVLMYKEKYLLNLQCNIPYLHFVLILCQVWYNRPVLPAIWQSVVLWLTLGGGCTVSDNQSRMAAPGVQVKGEQLTSDMVSKASGSQPTTPSRCPTIIIRPHRVTMAMKTHCRKHGCGLFHQLTQEGRDPRCPKLIPIAV